MGKYNVRELTPEDMKCIVGGCPGVYEVTPEEMKCIVGGCPGVYEVGNSYFIVGERVEAGDFGLEGKVGEGEVLIRVDRKLIDGMEK